MTCRPGNLKSSHCGRWKNRVFVFSPKISFQPIFDPKHPKNILEILLNQSMPTQKPTNRLKTRNPPKIKILLELRSVVLDVFKVKKHLNVTPLIIWNLLIQKSIVWWPESPPTTTFFFYAKI
jgi:hypothetical protein